MLHLIGIYYKKLIHFFLRLISKYINEKAQKDNGPSIVLINLLTNGYQLNNNELITCLADMLIIGVNASTAALSFILYNLALNPRTQYKLFKELNDHLPAVDQPITLDALERMEYLRACVKESIRLNPPLPYLCRVTQSEVEVNQYRIPVGTVFLMAHYMACTKEENFIDANKFKPERWLASTTNDEWQQQNQLAHQLATIPYGYGKRANLAKELIEMQLAQAVARVNINYNFIKIVVFILLCFFCRLLKVMLLNTIMKK